MNDVTTEKPRHYDTVDSDGVVVESNLALLQSSEIDQQIATAHRYPRSLTKFRQQVLEQVTLGPEIAGKCIYALPRDGKVIEGPSIRFAEIIASCWGNNRIASRIVDIGTEFITAQGVFHDLEKNSAITFEVLRRITNREGRRYSSDMIGVTGNAAASIALRNAITRGIPQAFWADHLAQARKIIAGDVRTLGERRDNMMKEFVIFGVAKEQIFGLLGVKGIEDINIEHLVLLAGLHTAIKDGDTSPEDAFALDKMAPGYVIPARPERNEFTRKEKEPKKARAKKGEPAPSEAAPVKTEDAPAAAAPKAEPAAPVNEAMARGLRILAGLKNMKDVTDLHDTILEELTEDDDRKAWNASCYAKEGELTGGKTK